MIDEQFLTLVPGTLIHIPLDWENRRMTCPNRISHPGLGELRWILGTIQTVEFKDERCIKFEGIYRRLHYCGLELVPKLKKHRVGCI